MDAVLAHRDRMAAHCKDEDQVDWLDSVSVDLIHGHGRLTGPRVSVRTPDGDTARLTARHAVGALYRDRHRPARHPRPRRRGPVDQP